MVGPICRAPIPRAEPRPFGQGQEERSFLLSFPSFPRPCPWTESGAWSAAAQPLQRPRARHLGVAVLPARRTWVRKAEWPVGAPQGWRPQSLSATRSTTRSPPVGARAEEPCLGPSQTQTGPALLGATGLLPAGTKEADGSEGEGGAALRCCGGDDHSQLRERPHLWSFLSPRVRLFL